MTGPDRIAEMPSTSLRWWRAMLIALTCAVLTGIWLDKATGFPIERDAYENLTAAYNLAHHGVISIQDDNSLAQRQPSEYREPLPIIVLAGYIAALGPVFGDEPLAELPTGDDARILKYSNIVWGALLALVVFGSIVRYTGSYALAAFGTIAVQLNLADQYDFLYSEIAGAALLALASCVFAGALRQRRLVTVFAAGLCFGAMTLTKASFLYVSVMLIVALAALGLWRRMHARESFLLKSSALLAFGMVVVVAPWMVRNYVHFDAISLSGRGGQVLLTRALKNNMTAEEYRGAWYAYAPRPLRWISGELTGFDKSDLEAGGRLQRLMRFVSERDRPAIAAGRPDDAVSYFARVGAMRTELEKARAVSGATSLAIDNELKQRALDMIVAAPLKHLAAIPLFLWRGAPYVFAILLAGAVYACLRRAWWLLAYVAPAMGLVMFYAVLTHFIPRYADPMVPIATVCFTVLAHAALQRLRARLRRLTTGHRGDERVAPTGRMAEEAGQ